MLSFKENHWNFKAIEFFSSLNLIPIEIDIKRGRIQIQSRTWRFLLWKTQFLLELSHWIFTVGRLTQSIYDPQLFKPDHFVLHYMHVLGAGFSLLISFHLFWSQPGELVIIFNDLHTNQDQLDEDDTGDEEEGKQNNKTGFVISNFFVLFYVLTLISFFNDVQSVTRDKGRKPSEFLQA